VWGAFPEYGVGIGQASRYGAVAAHSFVTAIGVLILFPVAGWAALAVWGLTSPPVTGFLARRRLPGRTAPATPEQAVDRGEQAKVDRAFGELVRGFHESA